MPTTGASLVLKIIIIKGLLFVVTRLFFLLRVSKDILQTAMRSVTLQLRRLSGKAEETFFYLFETNLWFQHRHTPRKHFQIWNVLILLPLKLEENMNFPFQKQDSFLGGQHQCSDNLNLWGLHFLLASFLWTTRDSQSETP